MSINTMFDYYEHVQGMDETKLNEEIKRLHDRLFTLSPESPMYDQLLDMINTANSAYNDLVYAAKFKDAKDESLDIGTMESTVITPDYSKVDLLDAVVTAYRTNTPKKE